MTRETAGQMSSGNSFISTHISNYASGSCLCCSINGAVPV